MLEIIKQFVRRMLMGKGKGILKIPPQKNVDDFAKDLLKKFKQNGVPDEAITNPRDVKIIWEQITNREAAIFSNNLKDALKKSDPFKKVGEVVDLTGKKIPPGSQIMGGKEVIVDVVGDTVTQMKAMTPMDAMKEANSVIARKGKYKNLTIEESQDILKKTNDHIFERDIKPDPEDLAGGGIAGMLGETDRVPYQHGSRQPGMERSVNRAAREKVTRDVRNLQQQMAQRGGGDARDYVSQHNLNEAVVERKKLIDSLFIPKGAPGTGGMKEFPDWMKRKWFQERWGPYQAWGQDLQYPYEDEEEIPEGILELLRKDPNFDLEEFKKIGWSTPENVWHESGVGKTSPDVGGKGLQGVYFGGYPEGIKRPTLPINQVPPGERGKKKLLTRRAKKVKVSPSGPPSERIWDPEKLDYPTTYTPSKTFDDTINLQHGLFKKDDSPMIANPNIPTSYVGSSRSSNVDKARTALHELRHKKYIENPELWKTQPEWVQNVEMPGTEEYYQNVDPSGQRKYMTGHELYNRFLDQRYYPPTRAGGNPYFDKILKDLWEPSAKKYENYDLSPVNLAGGGIAGMLGEPTYEDDNHRVPYKDGTKFNPKRRTVLKGIAALATIPFIGKYFKWAKPLAKTSKVLTSVPIGNASGMPAWFKPLVNKVIKEGDDVTKKLATKEREIVHRAQIDKDASVDVIQDLDTGNVRIEYDAADNLGYGPIQLDYKAGEVIEQGSKKGTKTKPEFSAVESEPRVTNWDGDIEFDGENIVNVVDDLLTDTTKLETYATGKNPNIKKLLKSEQKKKYVNKLNDDTMEQLDYIENKSGHMAPEHLMDEPLPDDYPFASGGRVPMFAGLIAKGGQKLGKFSKSEILIKMLEKTLKGSKDPWSKTNLPNFIKELKAKPELANDPQVWNFFTAKLPKNQRLVVHSDDTVDFWTQSEFGPHNIKTTDKFMQKHPNLSRDEAVRIQNMEPEDQILEMKRLETIRDRSRTKNAIGGLAAMLGE